MKKSILLLITCLFCMTSSLWAAEAYVVKSTDGQTLTFYYDNYKSSRSGTIYSLNTGDNSPEWVPEWDPESSSPIRWVEFNSSFANARPTTTNQWFYIFSYLLSIQSIQYLNTQNVTNMSAMFYHCDHLPSLDLSNFDTRNVTNMSAMFAECNQLRSLDVSNFDTRNVTDMSGMFARCVYLRSLDVSNFDTRNVTDMSGMFASCGLRSLDLSNFDTRNVTDMSRMFSVCQSLTNLNVGNFDTRNVTDMSRMFQGCNLTSLDVSNFDTRNVTNMSSMFLGCSGGTNFKVTNFNTSNVTTMKEMFAGCSGLTSLDLSNFDMSKVTSSSYMLGDCSSLKSLSISPTMENIASNACSSVGTETNPCVIYAPKGFDFGVDTSGDYFVWKGGYFTLGKQEYEGKMGDVNNDGVVSISDAICIISWLQENTLPVFIEGAADYNEDGSITVSDALAIIRTLLNEEDEPATHIGEAIDLGLPSGLKWASYNIGATSPEEIGGYYAWGETEEKNGSYDESTYNYYHSSFDNLGANISGTNYDVAHIKWGGTWRMPTKDDFDELIKHCSLQYSTLNNVNGITFVGPNGNSIFLPTAGFRRFQGSLGIHNGEKWGYYWTSTLSYYQYEYCAYNLFINYQSYAELQLVRGFRTKGLLVRPVTE